MLAGKASTASAAMGLSYELRGREPERGSLDKAGSLHGLAWHIRSGHGFHKACGRKGACLHTHLDVFQREVCYRFHFPFRDRGLGFENGEQLRQNHQQRAMWTQHEARKEQGSEAAATFKRTLSGGGGVHAFRGSSSSEARRTSLVKGSTLAVVADMLARRSFPQAKSHAVVPRAAQPSTPAAAHAGTGSQSDWMDPTISHS